MAIIIDSREKKGMNWFAVFIIIILIVIIGIAAYFLFFSKIPLIEKTISQQLEITNQLSQLEIQSQLQAVTKNKIFQSLQKYATLSTPSLNAIGKTNPFAK